MKQFLGRYLSTELSDEKQLYNLAVLLGMIECVVILLLSIIVRLGHSFILLMSGTVVISYFFLLLGEKMEDSRKLSAGYLFVMYILMVPGMYLCSDLSLCFFPCYLITGIVFAASLLHGWLRIIGVFLQLFIDLYLCYQAIVIGRVDEYPQMQGDVLLCVRLLTSIFITGTICGFMLTYQNRKLRSEINESARIGEKAEETNNAQNIFLVNVSHEIRTPLNAIQGTIELLLDMDINDKVKENIFYIDNASKALLSITNDLLDFSMIDEDSIKLEEKPYHIGKMLGDIINIFSVRYEDSQVDFFVDVPPSMTAMLVGDGAKLEQIILSYITAASQYLSSGRIYLRISEEKIDADSLNLSVHLETRRDAGDALGDRKEDVDEPSYEPVFQIRENLCEIVIRAMGGELAVTDDGERRCYDFRIVQRYEDETPLVENDKYGTARVLLFENTKEQNDIFAKILTDMGITYVLADDSEMFYGECVKEEYTHILLAMERYEEMEERLNGMLPPQSLVLISTGMNSCHDELVRTIITRPISCLNLDILLAGKKNYAVRNIGFSGEFECPQAKIMVVDDNIINLEVAGELLKKYTSHIITAISGKECLNTLQEESVDFIFLDYMMPEMDGIETLKNIRSLGISEMETVPIIALTANVVSGAKEMFLEAGFDDYISKPIEIDKFEKVLREHLDPEKIVLINSREESYGA